MIMPLFGGLTQNEVLAAIAGMPSTDPYKLVYETITGGMPGGEGDALFSKFLHDGLLEGTAFLPVREALQRRGAAPTSTAAPIPPSPRRPSRSASSRRKVDDGRFINNGWLQECPDPITKISWDNAILVSPRLAKELGIDPRKDGLRRWPARTWPSSTRAWRTPTSSS
jgi:hypothetical protein